MEIKVPKFSLIVLIGPSGSGKSTFAKKHFLPTEVVSSDLCRAMVCDDENNQQATPAAFKVLMLIARKRLSMGRLTVIDATNVQPEARLPLLDLARTYKCIPVALVFDLPLDSLEKRRQARSDRQIPPHVLYRQKEQMDIAIGALAGEGFRLVFRLDSEEAANSARILRMSLNYF